MPLSTANAAMGSSYRQLRYHISRWDITSLTYHTTHWNTVSLIEISYLWMTYPVGCVQVAIQQSATCGFMWRRQHGRQQGRGRVCYLQAARYSNDGLHSPDLQSNRTTSMQCTVHLLICHGVSWYCMRAYYLETTGGECRTWACFIASVKFDIWRNSACKQCFGFGVFKWGRLISNF